MHIHTRILKLVVFLLVLLLSTSLLAQIKPQSGSFLSGLRTGELSWLERKNFDIQFYDGSDSLINQYLVEALRYRRNGNLIRGAGAGVALFLPPVGVVGIAFGSQEVAEGVEFLNAATIRRNDLLLGGRTFEGLEEFRQKERAQFYRRHNFHVDHYDGNSQDLNIMLNEAYRWRNKASDQFKVGLGTNVGGLGMMLLGLFSLAFGDGDSAEPLITAGALVHVTSYGFFISGFSKRRKARKMVNQVARKWYQQVNQNRLNTIKHLSD